MADVVSQIAPALEGSDVLSMLEKQFTEAVDNPVQVEARQEAEQARQYYDGIQWTSAEIAVLKARNQAPITDNKIKDKIEYMRGMERRTRTDPKAYPRNPGSDDKSAEAATDGLRFVFDQNEFKNIRSECSENLMVEGTCAAEVVAEAPKVPGKNPKVKIRKIRWDRHFADPFSRELDFSDAGYQGIVTWMDEAVAKRRWPGMADRITESMATKANSDTHEDRPRWLDGKRKRVQVIQTEYMDPATGVWTRAVWFKGGILEPPAPSYYVNEDGEKECCIVAQSLHCDPDGKRYGLVRRYKTLQDEINHRRSKALHILNTRQIRLEKGAVDDINVTRKEAAKPDGVLEFNPGMLLEVEKNLDLAEGQYRLLADAQNALSVTGPNAAQQGVSGALSGRAKEFDAEGGSIQSGVFTDAVRRFQQRIARASWNRIKQFWDQEQWVRVRDDEGRMMFNVMNQPTTEGEKQAELIGKMNIPPEQKQQQIMALAQNPASQQPIIKNAVANMDVDIIIEETPDTPNIQAEQFEQFVLLAKAGVVFPPDVYVEASALRNKEKIMQRLKGATDDPEAQAAMQKKQQIEDKGIELEFAAKGAEIENTQADTRLKVSETHENEVDAATDMALTAKEMATPIEKPQPSPGANGR